MSDKPSGSITCEICGKPIYYAPIFQLTNDPTVFEKHRHIFCHLAKKSELDPNSEEVKES